MNVEANSRASSATRHVQHVPMLRAAALFNDRELAIARLAATWPSRAQEVIDYLAPMAARRPLDGTLTAILRTARGTMSRIVARRAQADKAHFN